MTAKTRCRGRGLRLALAGGEEIGRVDEVVGDPQVDIFDGLVSALIHHSVQVRTPVL